MSKNTTKKEVPNYKFIYQYKVKKKITLQLSFASQFTTPIFDDETIEIGCILTHIFNEILYLTNNNIKIQNKYYKLTNELVEKYILANNVDGIIYPSAKTNDIPIKIKHKEPVLNLNAIDLILRNGKNPKDYLETINRVEVKK